MTTSTNRQLDTDVSFLAANAYAGGIDYDWRLSPMYNITGYFAGTHIAGNTEAISRLQENNVHGFQRPDADYMGVDADATSLQRPCRLGVVRQDLRREHALQQLRRLQVAGLRHQRSRFHAPRRRAQPVELVPVAQLQAGQVRAHAQLQHQPVRRLELRRRPHVFGRQRQLALDVRELLQHRRRLQPRCRAVPRSRDARRPGRARQPEQGNLWYYANTDNRKALSFFYNGGHWADTQEQLAPRHHARRQLARDLVDVAQPRPALLHQPRRFAVGRERRSR